MKLKKLESFRENAYGQVCFILGTRPPITLPFNYDLLAIHAYRLTTRCLRDLEQSQQSINNGLEQLPAISMWFQSVHAFLNSLLQVACLKTANDFEQLHQYPLELKFNHLFSLFAIDKTGTEESLAELLADFSLFERSIKRSFMIGHVNSYHRAKFSVNPMLANQADVLQCMLISIQVFQSFRFTITGLDLMPQISLQISDKLLFDRLDLLFRSVILPSLKDILSKQDLTLELELDNVGKSYPASSLFKERDILIIEKVIEDDVYNREEVLEETDILGYFFNEYAKKFEDPRQRFGRNYLAPGFDPLIR